MTIEASCLACGGALRAEPTIVGTDRVSRVPGRWPMHECTACGSATTLPLVTEQQLGAFYPADYTPFEPPAGVLAEVMDLLQRARNRSFPLAQLGAGGPPGVLLDVGCGRGDLAASWIDAGWRVLGIEPSPQAAHVARRRGAEVFVGTLATVNLPHEPVDAVVFRHSLEHVVDPRGDLERAARAMVPGGRIAVIVPNWSSWQRRAFKEHWFPLEVPRHRTHFTAAGLRAALRSAGFGEVDVRSATPFITTTWSLQLRVFDRVVTAGGLPLLAGYACAAPMAIISKLLDTALGGGDFLHAHAVVGHTAAQAMGSG